MSRKHWLVNKTAYSTDDLRTIVEAYCSWKRKRPPARLLVSDYNPGAHAELPGAVGQTIFVKLQRTGDTDSPLKQVGLVKPSKMDLDDLILMAVLHRKEAPKELIKQLWWRLHMIYDWREKKGPTWWDVSSRRLFAESSLKECLADREAPFVLRFAEKGPRKAVVEQQSLLWTAEREVGASRQQLKASTSEAARERRYGESALRRAADREKRFPQQKQQLEDARTNLAKLEKQYGLD